MKTEQEQIKEIMETLLAHQPFIDVPYEKIYDIAIALAKEGYGNISEYKAEIERLKDIVNRLKQIIHDDVFDQLCPDCAESAVSVFEEIDELLKEYGIEE